MAGIIDVNPTVVPQWIRSWEAFIKAHERMVLIVGAGLVLWHYGNKIENIFVQKHLAEQSQTNQQIAQLHNDNATLHQQIADIQAAFNAKLAQDEAIIAQKKQAVIIQQKIDAQLPPVDLSSRWESLLVLSPGSVTPQSNGTIQVSMDAAHATVNELEKVGPLVDENTRLTNDLNSCTALVAKKDTEISGKQAEIDLEKKGRAEDAKVAADKQRKSFWKGFKFGYVAGIGTAVAIKVATILK